MVESIVANELIIRFCVFIGLFSLFALLEMVRPRRELKASKLTRWLGNWSVSVINTVVLKLAFPVLGVGVAILASKSHWGLLNWVELPLLVSVLVAVLLLDLVIYCQHRLYHRVPFLWRLHRMHHKDLDFDVTTGFRFHPFSIVLSTCIKLAAVVLLGAPPIAVIIADVLLNGTAIFNHSNFSLSVKVDRVLRLFVVTPDMHRVHHSVRAEEHNSNFGFNFPWWDRLFGTYCDQPLAGHERMEIGLEGYQESKVVNLGAMLVDPLLSDSILKD